MTLSKSPTQPNGAASTRHLPRILCLHGGGVNAQIFQTQCRVLIARLAPSFRLVFVEGPFLSQPHDDILSVYGDCGPFRRWLRWLPEHPEVDAETAMAEIRYECRRAMDEDPGSGEWVGVLGFSQGAKIAASLLWTQERLVNELGAAAAAAEPTRFRFGILMAGRGPVVCLDERLTRPAHIADAGQLGSDFTDLPTAAHGPHALAVPTLHVHGTRDTGLELHRLMMRGYCPEGTATLIEWDGGHRLPIKPHDVDTVVKGILAVAQDAGVSC